VNFKTARSLRVPERTIAVGELSVAESVVEADAHYAVGGELMVMHPKVEGWPPPKWQNLVHFWR
jgi:hypothetical protein